MFTGIVTAMGTVDAVRRDGDRLALTIRVPWDDLTIGESVAVNGACLTIVDRGEDWFVVEAVVTTRGRTRFGGMDVGERVNLERAMQMGDRFGGHLVQGHVDGVGSVLDVRPTGDAVLIDLSAPEEVAEVSVPYGSVAVDGVSRTVNAVPKPGVIQLSVIPFTLEHTTLGGLRPGDRVHLEADMIGKYVRQLLGERRALPS